MEKFGLKKKVNENKYHGINEAHTDDRGQRKLGLRDF